MQIVRRIPRTSRVVLPNDPHHVDFLFEKIFEKILLTSLIYPVNIERYESIGDSVIFYTHFFIRRLPLENPTSNENHGLFIPSGRHLPCPVISMG